MLLFVEEWDDAFNFPYAEVLGYTQERIAKVRDENPEFDSDYSWMKMVSTVESSGQTIQTEVYNLGNFPNISLNCFSLMLVDRITDPDPNNLYDNISEYINCE